MSKNKISLIIGANGFVGANLTHRLLKEGFDVHIILRKTSSTWRINDVKNRLKIHIADITRKKHLKDLFNKIKPLCIFHLAAYGSYPHQVELSRMIDTNIKGLENILETSKDVDYKSFILAGSSSEYGYKRKPMREGDLLEPASFYAATKASSTLVAQTYAKLYNKPITILRLFSVYGPYEESTRLIPVAISSALSGKKIYVTAETIRRDFIFVQDVVTAFIQAANMPLPHGEIINIGTGKQHTNDDIINTISSILGKKLNIHKGGFEPRQWDTDYWVADNKRAKKLLHWYPKFSIETGLTETIKWFKKNINLYP